MPGPDEEPLTPGQLMGLAGLLRAWRATAGEKRGLGRPMSQEEVVVGLGYRSLRWYQALESGARPRLDRQVIDALADVLLLGRDERAALHLYALGTLRFVLAHQLILRSRRPRRRSEAQDSGGSPLTAVGTPLMVGYEAGL
ncbi:helix-turn-helix domain-containing protein [Streptomyces sp. NPDC059568]|uniref:helix-turn-helix domain-containing protein n=1 Tax=Streptomyces sp. NPDC059568 TaxID=3346868 RepID=UPI00367C88F8